MPNAECKIGVLALQGGYAAHISHLKKLGVQTFEVTSKKDLEICDGLIIPGGESTTINHHLKMNNLIENLLEFASHKPLFGTCAGLIIMAQQNLLPVEIKRNAYGRQSSSFSTILSVQFPNEQKECKAIFIRAPQISSINGPNINLLASYNQQPVFIQYQNHLGASFHPELTSDLSCHRYFLQICRRVKRS